MYPLDSTSTMTIDATVGRALAIYDFTQITASLVDEQSVTSFDLYLESSATRLKDAPDDTLNTLSFRRPPAGPILTAYVLTAAQIIARRSKTPIAMTAFSAERVLATVSQMEEKQRLKFHADVLKQFVAETSAPGLYSRLPLHERTLVASDLSRSKVPTFLPVYEAVIFPFSLLIIPQPNVIAPIRNNVRDLQAMARVLQSLNQFI